MDPVKIAWACHYGGSVNDTPDHNKIVKYLGKLESTLEKALTRWSEAQTELFDEKIVVKTKILWQGSFNK
jgi:hypothetical protein